MRAMGRIPASAPAELLEVCDHASATVAMLERLAKSGGDSRATELLVLARRLVGAIDVEVERHGGGDLLAAHSQLTTEPLRLAAACDALATAIARRGGPGAAAVQLASRRLIVAVEQVEQRDRRLEAEVLRRPAAPRALTSSIAGTSSLTNSTTETE